MAIRSTRYKNLVNLEDERAVQEREYIIRTDKMTGFYDKTGEVPGTIPEKIVYNYLTKLKVRFEFQYHYPENWDTSNQEGIWIPDFMLPDYRKTLIEVYGTYWHTTNRDNDQIKKAYWLADGYTVIEKGVPIIPTGKVNGRKVVIWWENDIYMGIDFLFTRDLPEIFQAHIKGAAAPEIRDVPTEFNKLKSMRASIAARKREPKFITPVPKIQKLVQKIYGREDYERLAKEKAKRARK